MELTEKIITEPVSDNELITRILEGEKNLYSVIVRRYNQRLYRVAMSIIDDDTEAEDIMQVTYIKAYENLPGFAFKASFSTWLTRILINESIARLKFRRKQINMNDDFLDMERYRTNNSLVPNPASRLLNEELKAAIEKAIRQLPEKYRAVFIMREIEQMNIAETRACLDISEVNVKVRLNRAKALLRESLSGFYKNEEILNFHLRRCDGMVQRVMSGIGAPVE